MQPFYTTLPFWGSQPQQQQLTPQLLLDHARRQMPWYGPQNPQGMPSSSLQPMASQGLPPPQQQAPQHAIPMPQPRPQQLPFYGPTEQEEHPVTAANANGGDLIKKFMAQLQNAGAGGAPGAYGTTSTM